MTVGAGIRYGDLAAYLHRQGFALHNLASLPHISVAGACMTATHGSGDALGNLATAVLAMELVTGDGDVITLSASDQDERFLGTVVGLGALGIVTRLTLRVEPAFEVRQAVYLDLPLETACARLDALFGGGYSVSLFTDWRAERFHQVWVKRRADEDELPGELFGARQASKPPTPCRDIQRGLYRAARSRSDRGTRDCRIFAWSLPRAVERSYRASTLSHVDSPRRR